ncbi:MAG: AarF/ABC1/UbiB kinase family protein [Deltaproteobacteria bacterium]|nr:AarF/ABC1/UbiB kinase family protein [Deltaproteobacteria bacterium]
MIREAFQDLARLRQIAAALVRHGFGEVLARSRIADVAKQTGGTPDPEALQKSGARRFRELLAELGPTFTKLGQMLSTRPDLLPALLVDELTHLQDQAPALPIAVIEAEIERALGKPAKEIFASISPEPLASASIAQAHLARTLEGDEVVVKVQRPNIAESIRADVDLLYYLATALEAVVEEAGIYAPRGIVEEFDRTIREELDFANEAENLRLFLRNHADRPYVKIPKVHDALSGRTVLTMERLHGAKITEANFDVHNRKTVAQHLVEASFHQLFDDGAFHGDPHPGNVLVLQGEGNVIGLIDFGLVGKISRQMQETIVTLVMAIALKDADTAARVFYRVGSTDHRANLTNFRDDIAGILERNLSAATTIKDINAQSLMREILDLAVRYRIRVPKEYAVLGRASILVEGIIRKVYPDLNVLEFAQPYVQKLLKDRLDPGDLQGSLMRMGLRLQNFATEVPLQLSQILVDLETGKLTVSVRGEQLDKLGDNVRGAGLTVFLGILSAAFLVGAFISFSRYEWFFHGVPVLGLLGLVVAGGLFGAGVSWYLLAGRLRKIRISRWLKPR